GGTEKKTIAADSRRGTQTRKRAAVAQKASSHNRNRPITRFWQLPRFFLRVSVVRKTAWHREDLQGENEIIRGLCPFKKRAESKAQLLSTSVPTNCVLARWSPAPNTVVFTARMPPARRRSRSNVIASILPARYEHIG